MNILNLRLVRAARKFAETKQGRSHALALMIVAFGALQSSAQSDAVADSLHSWKYWDLDGDSVSQYGWSTEEFQNGRLVFLCHIVSSVDDAFDSTLIWHKYSPDGKRLSSVEIHSNWSECLQQVAAPAKDSIFGWFAMDDPLPAFSTVYVPCLIHYTAETIWNGDLAVRHAHVREDTLKRSTCDSVWYDAADRPLLIKKYSDNQLVYSERCSYRTLKGDSLQTHREIWDQGRSFTWLKKFVPMGADTIVVYSYTCETSPTPGTDESFWIYNSQHQQTAYIGKHNGKLNSHLRIEYDDQGLVSSHEYLPMGNTPGKKDEWRWVMEPHGTSIYYTADGRVNYTKKIEHQWGQVKHTWIYGAMQPWPVGADSDAYQANLQLVGYTQYDAMGRVILQQNYQVNGQLTYQAEHIFKP